MPNRDGTGPRGRGEMTGSARGRCVVPLNCREEEVSYLKNRAEALQRELAEIQARLARAAKSQSAGKAQENRSQKEN
jgi:hypothetical protein